MNLNKTLFFWFKLTNPILFREPQSTPAMAPEKGMSCPCWFPALPSPSGLLRRVVCFLQDL